MGNRYYGDESSKDPNAILDQDSSYWLIKMLAVKWEALVIVYTLEALTKSICHIPKSRQVIDQKQELPLSQKPTTLHLKQNFNILSSNLGDNPGLQINK